MMPIAARSAAIDRSLDPALIARFRGDLARLVGGDPQAMRFGVALSGGPDSCALLLLAHAAFPGHVVAATVEHGLRAESAAEAEFCARIGRDLGVSHAILPVDVPPGNLQSEARAARYRALADWGLANACGALLTAHHADDQAETLLMRLNRASGLHGLAGVRAQGSLPDSAIPLLRPLLGWRKAELAAVVAAAGIAPVADPSNAEERFDRVRMRRALAGTDWLDIVAIAKSAANLADAAEALDWATERELAEAVTQSGGALVYRPTAPFAICLRVMARLVARVGEHPREGTLADFLRDLAPGERANIAGALIERTADGWRIAPEPPRSG